MLARVAARSLRSCRTSAPAIQPVLPYIPFRSYAKNNKPKPRPYDLKHSLSSDPANRHGSNAQKSAGTAVGSATNQADSPTSQIKDPLPFPNPSKLQAEYDSIMSSRSGAPNPPPRPNPDPLSTYPGESRLLPDFSNLRESSTSTPSDGRTTPQSTSPSALDHSDAHSQDQLQSSQRLPDLTQGIPSTLDSEVSASSVKADPASLNITEDPSQPGGPGDLPKSAYISSMERRRDRIARWVFGGIITFVLTGVIYFGRNWDTEDEEKRHVDAPSGWGLGMFWNRIKARYRSTLDYYNEPAFPKLLPNTDPLWERPYTLVLSLEDMLVHSEWSREHGWRMAKRPGVDYFLRYLSQYYELVIFTSVPSMIGLPITKKLDPYQIVLWPLFREATRYQKGEYIKDLSFLNRDLSKVILMDTVPAHASKQPENAIILPKWKGDPTDKDLVSYIPFLEFLATYETKDTREMLKGYEGKHIPTEFARRDAILRERALKEQAESGGKRSRRSVGFLGNVLGLKTQGSGIDGTEQSISEAFEEGKTWQDRIRERGQKNYEILDKEIRENGEKWLKDMAEDEKKMNDEAMKGMKASFTSAFPFGLRSSSQSDEKKS